MASRMRFCATCSLTQRVLSQVARRAWSEQRKYLAEVESLSPEELLAKRYARLRAQGVYRAG